MQLQTKELPTPSQKKAIHQALQGLAAAPPDSRTRTHFCSEVPDKGVQSALAHYTVEGAMGQLLDSDVDDVAEASVMTFEISSLMELGEKNVLPVLLYLFRRIDKMARGQPGLLMIDEAWVVLSNPVFRERLRKWLKQKRKENWAVGIATQSILMRLRRRFWTS